LEEMSGNPHVSVVMSVYNGAPYLHRSVESVLSQQGVDLEFIVVNDGSVDQSLEILRQFATVDDRVRVISQENRGLTKALIVGCAAARGQYIAPQDAGDVSLPDRLRKQLELIRKTPNAAFVSCGTRYLGPHCEHLYDVVQNSVEATTGLLTLDTR